MNRTRERGGLARRLPSSSILDYQIESDQAERMADSSGVVRLGTPMLFRDSALTLLFNSLTLGVNLVTGVVIARGLGLAGRGQLSAIVAGPQLVGWIFAMGCAQATAFHQARHPGDASRLITTWLMLLLPMSLVAILAGEAMIPHTLAAQSPTVLALGRVYMLTIVLTLIGDLTYGVFLGNSEFIFFNLLRLGQPALTAAGYVALWGTHHMTLQNALIVGVIPVVLAMAYAISRAVGRYGLARPTWGFAAGTFWYGVRAHGTNVGDLVSSRLDLLIIPAFLQAPTVGLYVVATTVAGLVGTLSASLSILVLPVAARQRDASTRTVILLAQATFVLALTVGIALAAAAPLAVNLVYGRAFGASVPIIWLLMPGTVLYALAAVFRPALYAIGRPLTAASAYAVGIVITVLGLLVFLRAGGLVAAAVVSTISYAAVFFLAFVLYRRATGLGVRQFVPDRSFVSTWTATGWQLVRGMRRPHA